MAKTRAQITAWESRWAAPVAVATFLSVVLLVLSGVLNQVSGEGEAEIMRSTHEHASSVALTGVLQAVGFVLLAAPLFFLFRVVQARSPKVRSQLVGLVVVAPLFLAVSAGLSIGARDEAATQFVNGEAKSTLSAAEAHKKCTEEEKEKGAKEFGEEFEAKGGESALEACEHRKREDDEAENALGEASLSPISSGLGIAGGLGAAVAFFYSGLWAMRTGALTRFWASLGMASGIALLLGPLFFITLIWLVYFGLLILGILPGGKPPAWEAGEAVPWPSPGEKAAAELEPSEPPADGPSDEGSAANGNGGSGKDGGGGPGRRKRKQRD